MLIIVSPVYVTDGAKAYQKQSFLPPFIREICLSEDCGTIEN